MVPKIKLSYFDSRGRAEPIRLALTIGDIPFEDDRILKSQWADRKPTMPYGSVPVMTIDGKVAAQSYSLLRYVGKLTGLYPEDPLAALKVDEILDTLEDLGNAYRRHKGDGKENTEKKREVMSKEELPRYFGGLEKRLEMFGEGGCAVGKCMTIADLALTTNILSCKSGFVGDIVSMDALDGYPRAMKIYETVMRHPKVTAWFEKHPISNKFN